MASNLLDKLRLPLVLFLVQSVFAGMMVISRVALDNGVDILVYNFYRCVIALVVLVPAATCLERKTAPPLTGRLLMRIFILAFVGLTITQSCFLLGIKLTSATFSVTLQNVVPVFTFVIALMMRVEEMHLKRRDGWAKISGTLLCVMGAMTMSLYNGPALFGMEELVHSDHAKFLDVKTEPEAYGGVLGSTMDFLRTLGLKDWDVGVLVLVTGYIFWSLYLTYQAPILKEYPAPLTITMFTYIFAALQFFVTVFVTHENSRLTWTLPWGAPVLCVLYAGIMSSGFNYTVQTWCIKTGGPLLTAAFMPVQCVIGTALAVAFLGDKLFLGSCVGGIVIVVGVYLVIWGRAEAVRLKASKDNTDLEKAFSRIQSFSGGLTTPFLHDQEDKAPSGPSGRE